MFSLRTGVLLFSAGVAVLGPATLAHAASDALIGGTYHDQVLQAARRDLLGSSVHGGNEMALGGIRISVAAGASSALTGFTPRYGGFRLGASDRSRVDYGALVKTGFDVERRDDPQRREVRIGPDRSAEVAGLEIGWSAVAAVDESGAAQADGPSAFMVGGEFAISNWRLDAGFGDASGPLGLDGNRMTAGVSYNLGPLDTRVSYSLVDREETAEETNLLTLGSQLTVSPWLVVEGDVAYASEPRGEGTTAGRVSFRVNF